MKSRDVLDKMYEDKQTSVQTMYFYDEEDSQDTFGMSLEDVFNLIPKEFCQVVEFDCTIIALYGDFEKVYEQYTKSEEKQYKEDICPHCGQHNDRVATDDDCWPEEIAYFECDCGCKWSQRREMIYMETFDVEYPKEENK